jgi:hypothetical protein
MFRIKVVAETINLKQISYRSVSLVKREMLEGMGPVKPPAWISLLIQN